MSDTGNEKARAVYNTICAFFENRNYIYKRDDLRMSVSCDAESNDLPMGAFVQVIPENDIICFTSPIPVTFSRIKKYEAAVAINAVNSLLIDGIFDYDLDDGGILFRLSCSYRKREVKEALIEYIIECAFTTIDMFNDKFDDLSNEKIDLKQFLSFVANPA